jgi:hypothetical protein
MGNSYPVSAAIASVIDYDDHYVPVSYEDAHPAFSEGYTNYYHNMLQVGNRTNPYEQKTDSWAEYEDGYQMAHQMKVYKEHVFEF